MKRPSNSPKRKPQNDSKIPPPVPKSNHPVTPPHPPKLERERKHQPPAMLIEPPPLKSGESTNWLHLAIAASLGILILTATIASAIIYQGQTPQVGKSVTQPGERNFTAVDAAKVGPPADIENAFHETASGENAATRKQELLAAKTSLKKPELLPVIQSVAGRLSSRVATQGQQLRGLITQIPTDWSSSLQEAIATANRTSSSQPPAFLPTINIAIDEAKIAEVLAADLTLPAEGAECKADPRALETAIHWEESVQQAAAKATDENKLIYIIHVSGNFELPGFT